MKSFAMLRILSLIAVLAAALFAGAALYINVAEQPARLTLDTRSAVAQWSPSYMRATWMQAPLAVVSLVCGVAVWLMGGGTGWMVAAVLIGLVVPFTLLGIMPTNKSLLQRGRDLDSPDTRALLERWGRLHAVRTALSLVATVLYLCLLSRA
jgi:anthrone oxygenase-like protein